MAVCFMESRSAMIELVIGFYCRRYRRFIDIWINKTVACSKRNKLKKKRRVLILAVVNDTAFF
jgi:hypothetical protein